MNSQKHVLVSLVLATTFSGSDLFLFPQSCQAGPSAQGPGGPSAGGPYIGGPSIGGPSIGGPSAGGPSIGGPSIGGSSAGGPSIGGPSAGGSSNKRRVMRRGLYGRSGGANAAATIEQQALDLHQKRAEENDSARTAILKRAEAEAKQIKQQGDADASNYYWNYARRLRRRGWANDGVQDIKQDASNRAEQVMSKAREQAAKYEQDTRNHERTVRDVAESLQSQMQPTGGKGVRINPKGTNLYIRNYSH